MNSVFREISMRPYGIDLPRRIQLHSKGSLEFLQRLQLMQKLPVHSGCVNTLSWNDFGGLLLSGSDDQHLAITNGFTYKRLALIPTKHKANIFSAKFIPASRDCSVVSCSGDGLIIYIQDVERSDETFQNCFSCHAGTVYKVVTVPNEDKTFLSCGEDGTVRWFDLRMKTSCTLEHCQADILVNCGRSVTALAVDSVMPNQLAIGCCDGFVNMYDRRMISTPADNTTSTSKGLLCRFTVPGFEGRSHRITSLVYSANGAQLLASFSSEYLYLFDVKGGTDRAVAGKTTDSAGSAGNCSWKTFDSSPEMIRSTKKLRLRGDWSDTGPNARPMSAEREAGESNVDSDLAQQTPNRPHSMRDNLMRHMSDVLTQWMLRDTSNVPQQQAQVTGEARDEVEMRPDENSNASVTEDTMSSSSDELSRANCFSAENQTYRNTDVMVTGTSKEENVFVGKNSQNMKIQGDALKRDGSTTSVSVDSSIDQVSTHSSVAIPIEVDADKLSSNFKDESAEVLQNPNNDSKLQTGDSKNILEGMESAVHSCKNDFVNDNLKIKVTNEPTVLRRFIGHRNARTVIKEANFWGDDYVMSGSDCGHVFIWNRHTCELVMTLEADKHVVNCVQPHPFDPILATSGIDYDVKLWAPIRAEPHFDKMRAAEIVSRNEVMLEETRDTITVPVSFMIRMLASSISDIRQGGIIARWRRRAQLNRSNNIQD